MNIKKYLEGLNNSRRSAGLPIFTPNDLALAANVSVASVYKVLNGVPNVNFSTVLKILELMDLEIEVKEK